MLLISRVCICGECFNSCPDVLSSLGMMGTKGDVEIMNLMIPFNLKNKKRYVCLWSFCSSYSPTNYIVVSETRGII